VRSRVREAISQTVMDVYADARQGAPVSTAKSRKAAGRRGSGELRDTIRPSMADHGLDGYVHVGFGRLRKMSQRQRDKRDLIRLKQNSRRRIGPMRPNEFAKAQRRVLAAQNKVLGGYAAIIEWGNPSRGIAPNPFMRRALWKNQSAHTQRIRAALSRSVSDVARKAS
jgi:hypothetical protein